jgi:hypothetical protein
MGSDKHDMILYRLLLVYQWVDANIVMRKLIGISCMFHLWMNKIHHRLLHPHIRHHHHLWMIPPRSHRRHHHHRRHHQHQQLLHQQ